MTRVLVHGGALACALLASALFYAALRPTALEAGTMLGALAVIGWGLCVGRRTTLALVPAALAAAGLLLIGFSVPAGAATAHKAPVLSVVEQPAQPLALALPAAPAQVVVKVAQPDPADTSIALPVAEWAAAARNVVICVLLGIWGVAKNKLPAPILWALKLYGEQKLVEQAVNMGINAVPGAAKGEALSINVGSQVLAHALQWVVDTVPGFVVSLMGGEDGIKAKIFAALHLEPDASAAELGVKAAA